MVNKRGRRESLKSCLVWLEGGTEGAIFVRELVGRIRNVVLMNVYLDLGNPGGRDFG